MDEITEEIVERAAAAHWNVSANIKWDNPLMKEEWKTANRERMRKALGAIREVIRG